MDTEAPAPKPRRGRRPKSETASTLDSSRLKTIHLDDELKDLINRKTTPAQLENLRVKLPNAVIEELRVNVASLKQSGAPKIDENSFVRLALELANDNLNEILKRHLTQ